MNNAVRCAFTAVLATACGAWPSGQTDDAVRGRYVTAEGQTMVMLRGQAVFRMGSPPSERGRTPDETPHDVRIPRSFAIAATETTREQFSRFLAANPAFAQQWTAAAKLRFGDPFRFLAFTPTPDTPQVAVSWYDAARYCNWLSARDGIPRDQWVYPDDAKSGMRLPANYLRRIGYRLPTEAEWEYAARAGTQTARFFGDADDLLPQFAWFDGNTGRRRASPVGQLTPNPWGLFDVYGNVWEWTFDRRRPYPEGPGVTDDQEDTILDVSDEVARTRRGGSFAYESFTARSAHRGDVSYLPMQIRDNVGFRVARTLP